MSDAVITLAEAGPPAATKVRVPATAKGKEVAGKPKRLVDAMVWDGMKWDDAARTIGMPLSSARRALDRPHVRQYLQQQKQVFRASASAANIHAAVDVRDQKVNQTARIAAVRYLDGLADEDARRDAGRTVSPGVVVQVTVQQGERQVDETIITVNGTTAASEAADDAP